MNTEEDRSKYRIHKAVVESYNSRPYEFTVLKDLIGGRLANAYCISTSTYTQHVSNTARIFILKNKSTFEFVFLKI